MKTAKLLLIFLFISSFTNAQELTGFWSGTLSNDTTKKDHHFELALSEYRGKVTGYSYTTFISNDTFYYGIRRVKATRDGDVWTIEDDKFVVNNFPERANKGVGRTITFRMNKEDSTWNMEGDWKTNQTKRYFSVGGKFSMKEEKDIDNSTLASHLEELNLHNTLPFYQQMKTEKERKKAVYANNQQKPLQEKKVDNSTARTNTNATNIGGSTEIVSNNTTKKEVTSIEKKEPTPIIVEEEKLVVKSQDKQPVKTEANNKSTGDLAGAGKVIAPSSETKAKAQEISKKEVDLTRPIDDPEAKVVSSKVQTEATPIDIKTESPKNTTTLREVSNSTAANKPEQKPEIKNEQPAKPVVQNKPEDISITTKKETVKGELPTTVATRKIETIQQIYFKSDSLVLALYDNGVVDGDTVSVFINGQNIIEKQKLKEAATKKTIYIPANTDSVQLVLFAENLGTIPPNTGLLTIRDGDDVYQVRFSADMQKNAGVVFWRKQKP